MDPVGDVGDGRPGLERERLVVDRAVVSQPDADQAGQRPDRFAERVERRFVEHGDAARRRGRERPRRIRSMAPASASSARVAARKAGLSMPAGCDLGA